MNRDQESGSTAVPLPTETVTVELRREDAYVIGLAPFGYTCATNNKGDPWYGIVPKGGSATRARVAIIKALGHDVEVPNTDRSSQGEAC
jgi:hypothetical protein